MAPATTIPYEHPTQKFLQAVLELTEAEEQRLLQGTATWSDIERAREERMQRKERDEHYAKLEATNQHALARFVSYVERIDTFNQIYKPLSEEE